jgi:hypothetical protein
VVVLTRAVIQTCPWHGRAYVGVFIEPLRDPLLVVSMVGIQHDVYLSKNMLCETGTQETETRCTTSGI